MEELLTILKKEIERARELSNVRSSAASAALGPSISASAISKMRSKCALRSG